MKTLGPKLRQDVPRVASKLQKLMEMKLIRKLDSEGVYIVEFEGKTVELKLKILCLKLNFQTI